MVSTGWYIFSTACGIIVFVYMFFATAGDKPSFGFFMEEDKKARLQFYPTSTENRDGFIELSGDMFCFKDTGGENIISAPYSSITKCIMNTSTDDTGKLVFAQPSWGAAYHYLNIIYLINGVSKELIFRFNGPAFPYVKEVCSKINDKLKNRPIKKAAAMQPSSQSSAEASAPIKPAPFVVFNALLFILILTSAPSLIRNLWIIFNPPSSGIDTGASFWIYILYNLTVTSVCLAIMVRIYTSGSRKDWGRRMFLYIVMFDIFNTVIKNIFISRSFAPSFSVILLNLAIIYYFTRVKVKEVFEK